MFLKKFFWLLFAIFTLLLNAFLKAHPTWAEHWYSRRFFQGIRWVIDYVLGWLPFPLVYVLFGVILWRLVLGIKFLFFAKNIAFTQRLLKTVLRILSFTGGTVGLFYWLWGFNYARMPIEKQLDLPAISLTTDDLKAELETQTNVVFALRPSLQADTSLAIAPDAIEKLFSEKEIRQNVETQLQEFGFPTVGRVRGRQPFWKGFLLRFGAAGIYNPFTGESNIDEGLYFLTKPYTLAHEFCHGYGFSDEGTCNFLAYMALKNAKNPILRYQGELSYWREVAGTYRRLRPQEYAVFRANLSSGFRADLDQINQNLDKYPEFFAKFRYNVYDNYLKAQGISEGIENYSKVVKLVIASRRKKSLP